MNPFYIAASVVLLIANGFFVGIEFALIAARRTRIEELAAAGSLAANAAMRSLRELSFMLAGAQLGITMASLGLGYVAEPAIAHGIETALGSTVDLPQGLNHSIAFVIALTIVVFLHMVVGEMAPKNIAIAEAERSALFLAPPMRAFVTVLRPFIYLLNALSNGILRLFGIEPKDEVIDVHSSRQIAAMISRSAEEGVLETFKERLLSGAIELGERDAGSAMVPRTEMIAAPLGSSAADIEDLVVATGHSRFPIYREHLDAVVGFVHAKDLLKVLPERRSQPLERALIRPLLIVPESRKLRPLLLDMRRERAHFALVIDEHGGTAGIVTLEDLLEELVGDIRDEYDVSEVGVERLGEERYLAPGGLRIDEAETYLGIELPEGEYETVAGFLMDRLGRIPRRRDFVDHDGWRLRVRSMHRRRVVQVLIERIAPAHDDDVSLRA